MWSHVHQVDTLFLFHIYCTTAKTHVMPYPCSLFSAIEPWPVAHLRKESWKIRHPTSLRQPVAALSTYSTVNPHHTIQIQNKYPCSSTEQAACTSSALLSRILANVNLSSPRERRSLRSRDNQRRPSPLKMAWSVLAFHPRHGFWPCPSTNNCRTSPPPTCLRTATPYSPPF